MFTLTSQARSVAAFTLAFLLVTGELNRIGTALIAMFDGNLGQDQLAAASAVNLVVGAVVLWLARQAAAAATEAWTTALAQAGGLLAVVGIGIGVLTLAAALLQNGDSGYFLGLG